MLDNAFYRPIAERLRQARTRRGLSQNTFGGLIGRSESWVVKAENGDLPLDRISILVKAAQVLRVPLSWLLRDFGFGHEERPEVEGIATLRRTMAELPLSSTDRPPRPLAELQADLLAAQRLRAEVRHLDCLAVLPQLLTDLHVAAHHLQGEAGVQAATLLARGYEITARAFGRYDEPHLALTAAERVLGAAQRSGRPEDRVFAANSMALGLQGLGYLDEAVTVAEQGLTWSAADAADPRVRALRGCAHLFPLSVSLARRGDHSRAREALEEASAAAGSSVPADIRAWTVFGPANVAIHRVLVALDSDNPGESLHLADGLHPVIHRRGTPRSLRSRHLLNVATAANHRRDTDRMVATLLEVERLAPEQLRNHVMIPEMLHSALRRERGPRNAALHALAHRLSVA